MSDEKDYQQQIEAGKSFVRETLAQLAIDLKQPDITNFTFKITSNDFDNEEVSIFDPKVVRVVAKLKKDDLADSPATPSVRTKLRNQLTAAVRAYYKDK